MAPHSSVSSCWGCSVIKGDQKIGTAPSITHITKVGNLQLKIIFELHISPTFALVLVQLTIISQAYTTPLTSINVP